MKCLQSSKHSAYWNHYQYLRLTPSLTWRGCGRRGGNSYRSPEGLQRVIQPSHSFSYPTFTTKGWKKCDIVTALNLDQVVLKLSVLETF